MNGSLGDVLSEVIVDLCVLVLRYFWMLLRLSGFGSNGCGDMEGVTRVARSILGM